MIGHVDGFGRVWCPGVRVGEKCYAQSTKLGESRFAHLYRCARGHHFRIEKTARELQEAKRAEEATDAG